jgi:biotin operon repressor
LTDSPQSREVIRNSIWENYKAVLSLKTIGSHLDTLRKLGVPVAHRGKNKYTSDRKHGYYLDKGITTDVHQEEVASLGTSINCLLVLFALQQAATPMRQADIIRWIEEIYCVKIGRVAVSRQIDSLRDMRYYIEQTKDGYVLKK